MREINPNLKENYIQSLMSSESDLKKRSREESDRLQLSRISLSQNEGALLRFLVALHQGKKYVEIGTLTGLSAQYIADVLPAEGQLWTLEKSAEHAESSRKTLAEITQCQVNVVEGDAVLTLVELSAKGPFDGVFIDGNKAAYGKYLDWAENNLSSRGFIVADNVFLSGAVWGQETTQKFSEKQIKVMQEFNQRLFDSEKYISAMVPTDEGMIVAVKRG